MKLEVGKKYVMRNSPTVKYVLLTRREDAVRFPFSGRVMYLSGSTMLPRPLVFGEMGEYLGTGSRVPSDLDLVAEYLPPEEQTFPEQENTTTLPGNLYVTGVLDMPASTAGVRHNQNKTRWSLLPSEALEAVAEVLTFGAKKYAAHNWRKGLSWSETEDSAMRHLNKWKRGENIDPESGLHHLAHFTCNALFLLTMVLTGTGTDDRFSYAEAEEKKKADIK